MSIQPNGITPEALQNLITRLRALPDIGPAHIPTRNAISDYAEEFREAMAKGYSLEQLVEIWSEHGSPIKAATFAGYLRKPEQTDTKGKKKTPVKGKGPSRKKPELPVEETTTDTRMNNTPPVDVQQDHEDTPEETSVLPENGAGPINKRDDPQTTSENELTEDDLADAILARLKLEQAAGSGDGHGR